MTGYQIYRGVGYGGNISQPTLYVADTGTTATVFLDNDVRQTSQQSAPRQSEPRIQEPPSGNLVHNPNTLWHRYQVRAINPGGVSAPSYRETQLAPRDGILAPRNLTATATRDSVTLNWDPQASWNNGRNAILNYQVHRRLATETNYEVVQLRLHHTTTEYVDRNVTPGTDYVYRLASLNGGASGAHTYIGGVSNEVSILTVDPLVAPTNLSATATHDAVTLTWDASDNERVTGYRIERDGQVIVADTGSADATYVDTTVAVNTGYEYRVSALRSGEAGPAASVSITTPLPPLPAAPTNLSATATHNSVTLTWDAPAADGYVTGYQILRRQPPGEATLQVYVADTGSTATEWTDTNVEASTAYVYRVKAINAAGAGSQSNFVRPETLPIPPPATPGNLSATATHDAVTLTWDASDDDRVTGYRIERDGQVIVANTGSTDASYVDATVAENTAYEYRVSAIGSDSSVSDAASVSITTPLAPLAAPTNLSATATHDAVTLTWDASDDDRVTGYWIERDGQVLVANTDSTDASYVDTTVAASTSYGYEVRAVASDSRVGDAAAVSIRTANLPSRPSQAPQNLRASSSSGSVTLTWDAPDDDTITGYQIIRRIPIGPNKNDWSVIVDDTDTTATTYVDSDVETGTRYLYRVKAVNDSGVGPQSNNARVNVR